MEFKAKDIASLLNGVVEGDPEAVVDDVSKIEEGKPRTLAFLSNPKYERYLYTTQATVVLVNRDFVPAQPVSCTLIRVESAYEAIAALLQMYDGLRYRPSGIEQPSFLHAEATVGEEPYIGAFAYIGKGARIGKNVRIYPHVYVGENVRIGDNTVLYAGVKVYHDCVIGDNCTVHAGSVIGADGFGFAPSNGAYSKVPQIGNVVLEEGVEIGANTCIDRATMGSTVIRKGVKLDNLIQVGHNAVIGAHTVMAAQVGVAGTSKVGANCMIGGQAGIAGHIELGDGVKMAAQAGVGVNVAAGSVIMGAPAFDASKYQRCYVLFRKLPDLYGQIRELEKEIQTIKSK
ncbi:MAG: UDP-3-O-(3-hydroxymyristoyl)glucosamine N-acyltransferase [Culturomica sp.]|jgi:UDP-3-O-[3-hydroxymyristoyl] glucosamine N-acyltransferase|nr:UDP-3-O-(3-hydroxymyristoyl)glucosamine N-acyltransferase [Culturomica sp.]